MNGSAAFRFACILLLWVALCYLLLTRTARIDGMTIFTIVASGMKVALITTIFGIIVALILQLFYNYILTKIEHLTSQMEESAISLLDTVMKYKLTR